MTNEVTKTKRPSSVTLISIFAIYTGVVLLYLMTRAGIQKYGVEETVFNVISGIVFLISGIGLWLMKKWAVYLFAFCAFANQIFLLLMGRWTILSPVLLIIIIFIGFKNLSKMS